MSSRMTNLARSLKVAQRRELTDLLEGFFEKYRFYKAVTNDKNFTGFDTDTERDERADQIAFCERVERVVESLPEEEREVIKLRYMRHDYVYNFQVCQFEIGISYETYAKRRFNAFLKLAEIFKLDYPQPQNLVLTEIG